MWSDEMSQVVLAVLSCEIGDLKQTHNAIMYYVLKYC